MRETLGDIIRNARIQKGLTQKQAANICYICEAQIVKLEKNLSKKPRVSTLEVVAKGLDLDLDLLLEAVSRISS